LTETVSFVSYRSITVTVLLPLFNCQGTDFAIWRSYRK
jgi:hypothetical protein